MKKIKLFFMAMTMLVSSLAYGQSLTVSGVVTDSSTGEGVPYAAIQLKDTMKGGSTDGDGYYSIEVPANGILVFSSVGYETQEVAVSGKAKIDVELNPDKHLLEETIVVAFGTATKESFTGSATVVKSGDIAKVQSSDVTRALEGVVAGVQMTTASGTLGSSPSIMIRGISSISAGTAPLYVVDGVPYPGDMNNLNPADIESMTVLKDAASNALYGARGANGVIMITTKKAKAGDAVVNFDAKLGWNTKALKTYDYITDPGQYYETHYAALKSYFMNESGFSEMAAHNRAATVLTGDSKSGGLGYNVYDYPEGQFLIGSNGRLNPAAKLGRIVTFNDEQYLIRPDNWMDETYKESLRQEYNVSVSASNKKSSFFASFGYLNNQGIIDGADMQRYTARLRADYQAKQWLKVGGNFAYTNFNYNNGNSEEGSSGSSGNIFAFASSVAPIYPVYLRNPDGSKKIDSHGLVRYDYGNGMNGGMNRPVSPNSNALQYVTLDKNNNEGNAINANGFAEFKFLKDFTFTFNAGVGVDETRSTYLSNMWYGQFVTDGGTLQKAHSRTFHVNLQQLLNYNKTFGKHNVNVLLGHENYRSSSYSVSAYKKKLFSMDNLELGGAVVDGDGAGSSFATYNNEGYFVRAQYDYDSKLFLSASYRRDASSRFHPDHRWGNFWSVGAGWLINHESWFNVPWVDMLKIKASIGSQGNDSISSYLYTDRYTISNDGSDGVAVNFTSKGNESITWETNTNFNAGFDFDLFKGRLSGTLEYFYRLTSDMLFFFTVPASLGYSGYYDNIGDMANSGIELALNGVVVRNNNVRWDVYANFTHYKNEVVMLPEERKTVEMEGYRGYASGTNFIGEGLPLYTYKMAQYAGVDQTTGKSLWYRDEDILDADGKVTGKKKVTTDDYSKATDYLCGDPTPDLYGGFGTSIQFYGFDASVSFTYSIGGLAYDSGYASLMAPPTSGTGSNFHKDLLKSWTKENPSNDIPRFQYMDKNVSSTSDRFLTDASYLNFQNAQFGYTFPTKLTQKIKVNKLRLYLSCDNICYWSKRHGLDPRQSFSGSTSDSMNSPVRTLSGGINITF